MNFRKVRTVISHACIVAALMVLVFFIIDRLNPAMEFMTSDMSKGFFLLLAALSFTNGVMTVYATRRAIQKQEKHAKAILPIYDKKFERTGALDAARLSGGESEGEAVLASRAEEPQQVLAEQIDHKAAG